MEMHSLALAIGSAAAVGCQFRLSALGYGYRGLSAIGHRLGQPVASG
jgi:hypothetical protein